MGLAKRLLSLKSGCQEYSQLSKIIHSLKSWTPTKIDRDRRSDPRNLKVKYNGSKIPLHEVFSRDPSFVRSLALDGKKNNSRFHKLLRRFLSKKEKMKVRKLYFTLETKVGRFRLNFGGFRGKTLTEVHKLDPEYLRGLGKDMTEREIFNKTYQALVEYAAVHPDISWV